MDRSGYVETDELWSWVRYRGSVKSAIRGQRGQSFLRCLANALDAMPRQRLIAGRFSDGTDVCPLGALARATGIDLSSVDPEDPWKVAELFDIAEPLAREVAFVNDDAPVCGETPEQRWARVRRWVHENLDEKGD